MPKKRRPHRVSRGILLALACPLVVCVFLLVWKVWNIGRKTFGYSIPLVDAARAGKWEEVKRLLEQGDDPNETSDLQNNHTALYWAVGSERRDVVEALIKHKIRVEHDDFEHITTPPWRKKHPDMARLLDEAERKNR